jgi:hypothetical protein
MDRKAYISTAAYKLTEHREAATEVATCLQATGIFRILGTMLQIGRSRVRSRLGEFLNLPNPTAALGPGVYSASNRNEYQKHRNNVSGE